MRKTPLSCQGINLSQTFSTFTGTTFKAGILALGSMGTALIRELKLGSLK